MLMARMHWLSEHASPRERAASAAGLRRSNAASSRADGGIMSSAIGAASRADGALTGVVRGPGGRPVAGACVTATGPSGTVLARSRAQGRYILPGLPSGQYALNISNCVSSTALRTYIWPRLRAKVAIGLGQVKALPAVTAYPADAAPAVRSSASPSQAGTGGISGRVTGRGHPLKEICAVAEPRARI
jgi:hypothetical protein